MTIVEHISELIAQAKNDLGASEALAVAGYYAHSLFFAHLVLEKLCKALWMRNKKSKEYPYIHNLIKLLSESNIILSDEQTKFYVAMNLFQAKGRYQESLKVIENSITFNVYSNYSNKLKTEIEWLTLQLQ